MEMNGLLKAALIAYAVVLLVENVPALKFKF